MWESARACSLVTKITNDSVHFIPAALPSLALPLDTHRLFQYELASRVLCCCSVWPHRLVRLFWYIPSSLSGGWTHHYIRTWICRLDSLWVSFFFVFDFREEENKQTSNESLSPGGESTQDSFTPRWGVVIDSRSDPNTQYEKYISEVRGHCDCLDVYTDVTQRIEGWITFTCWGKL